jgi:hypothetical protein
VGLAKEQPGLEIVFAGTAVVLIWLIFFASWLFYYAGSPSVVQNIAVFLLSVAIAAS